MILVILSKDYQVKMYVLFIYLTYVSTQFYLRKKCQGCTWRVLDRESERYQDNRQVLHSTLYCQLFPSHSTVVDQRNVACFHG